MKKQYNKDSVWEFLFLLSIFLGGVGLFLLGLSEIV